MILLNFDYSTNLPVMNIIKLNYIDGPVIKLNKHIIICGLHQNADALIKSYN